MPNVKINKVHLFYFNVDLGQAEQIIWIKSSSVFLD